MKKTKIVVTLTYSAEGNIEEAVKSIKRAHEPGQGRLERCSGTGQWGHYEAFCDYFCVAVENTDDEALRTADSAYFERSG